LALRFGLGNGATESESGRGRLRPA
jgi:hypothetical protein